MIISIMLRPTEDAAIPAGYSGFLHCALKIMVSTSRWIRKHTARSTKSPLRGPETSVCIRYCFLDNLLDYLSAASIFHPQFRVGDVRADLRVMIEGRDNLGSGSPRILSSIKQGDIPWLFHLRHTVVLATSYRAGWQNLPIKAVRPFGMTEGRWRAWVREVSADERQAAREAGRQRIRGGPGDVSDEFLAKCIRVLLHGRVEPGSEK
jgi:hypothetical protein